MDTESLNHEQFDALCEMAKKWKFALERLLSRMDATQFPENDPLRVQVIQLKAAVMIYIAELGTLGRPAFKRYAAAIDEQLMNLKRDARRGTLRPPPF